MKCIVLDLFVSSSFETRRRADDESTAIDAPGSADDPFEDAEEELDTTAREAAIAALGLDDFLCEALLSPDRAYVAQWDSQITAMLHDPG